MVTVVIERLVPTLAACMVVELSRSRTIYLGNRWWQAWCEESRSSTQGGRAQFRRRALTVRTHVIALAVHIHSDQLAAT